MTKKVYRTAQGKMVDIGALFLKNENVRAVGNMKVNARGDVIDNHNRPVSTRNQQVSKQYNRQVASANQPTQGVVSSRKQTAKPKEKARPDAEMVADPVDTVGLEPPPVEAPVVNANNAPLPEGGLAAAIARARQIKQEPLKTPRQQAQEKPGVNKL